MDKKNIEKILTEDLGEHFISEAEIEKLKSEHFDLLLLSEDANPMIGNLIPESLKNLVKVIPGHGADSSTLTNRVKYFHKIFPNEKILVHIDKDKEQNYKNSNDINFWFTEYATIEGYFLAGLKGKNCDPEVIR